VLLDHIDANLRVGDPVPSERELADSLDVSRMTARRALAALMDEGRVERTVGRGTFVSAPRIRMPIRLSSFTEDMRLRGFTPGAHTLSFTTSAPEGEAAAVLALRGGEQAHVIRRLRTADGVPMAIETVTLSAAVAPDLTADDLEDGSLYTLLRERRGIVFDGGEETVRARNATSEEAHLLHVPAHAAVLHLTRTSTWRGRPVEYTVSSYRGDRYELSTAI
jgi:GntR family transcriptional regulator